MTAIERIKLPEPDTHCFDDDTNSGVWSYSAELVREIVLAHIDKLEAEIHTSDLAVAEYRQQCLDNAQEIARLRAESEERLQNCVALGAENEQLRKDAERYRWLAKYLVSDDESHNDAIVAATTVAELDYVIDAAMKAATAAALERAEKACRTSQESKAPSPVS